MIAWIGETLAASAVLMVAVLLLRAPVARWFGPRVAYALWLLPALRIILPPLPGIRALFVPAAVIRLDGPEPIVRIGLVDPALVGSDPLSLPLVAPHGLPPLPPLATDWVALVLALWATGAVALLAWQVLRYRRFVRRALVGARSIGSAAGTEILVSPGVGGPVATGLVQRRILLPGDFAERYDRRAQRLVLDHEAAHHDRCDLLANAAALAVLALHWWNPLAWVAHRAFRADQELACDATVAVRLSPVERHAYALALARSAGFATPAAAAALSPVGELKRRLFMLARTRTSRTRTAIGATTAVLVIVIGLAASASASRQPSDDQARPGRSVTALAASMAAREPMPAVPAMAAMPAMDTMETMPEVPPAATRRAAHRSELRAAQAARAAAAASRRADHAGRIAEAAGRRAAADAQRTVAAIDVPRLVRASLDAARTSLLAQCAAQGHPLAAGERDWNRLATCGRDVRADALASLSATQAALRRQVNDPDAGPAIRDALVEVDREVAAVQAGRD